MKLSFTFVLITTSTLFAWGFHDENEVVIVRDHFHYKIENVNELETDVNFKMGSLDIRPNTKREFDGYSEYSTPFFSTPDVEYRTFNNKGTLDIRTNSHDEMNSFHWKKDRFHHESEFKLPIDIPTELEIDFGMGEADIDLTNIQVNDLNIECGMGELDLTVEALNQVTCSEIIIEAGMGEFEGNGISLLRPEYISIEVGMGAAILDLSDPIENDIEIEVEVGLGSIELILPEQVNISARVHDHFLSSVELEGVVQKRNKYFSEKWNDDWPTVTLEMSVGMGSIEVKLAD